MGRIRTVEIKSITEQLLTKYDLESEFSADFRANKEKLKAIPEELPSKKVMNRVAGYLVKLFKEHQAEQRELLGKESVIDE